MIHLMRPQYMVLVAFGGVVSVAIFTTKDYMLKAAYENESKQSLGTRIGNQLAVALAITAWTMSLSGLMFFVTKKTIGIRTEKGSTIGGLDQRDFKEQAYESQTNENDAIKESTNNLAVELVEDQPKRSDM